MNSTYFDKDVLILEVRTDEKLSSRGAKSLARQPTSEI